MEERLPKGTLGGQAVIEGIMMKGTDSYSVAIRKPDEKIEVKLQKYQSYGDKHKWAKIPFIRGVVNFTESMVVGMKTLSYSSSFYEEEEEESKADKLIKDIFKEKAEGVIIGITLFLSLLLAIALFMMLPAFIGEFIGKWVESRLLLSLIEGIIRLLIFIIYVLLISQMEDIKRVFMYHGAEHKTINCYEAGEELTPENVAKFSRFHKRCGTSFLFIVMVISILVFMFITADQMWLRFLLRLLLIPVVAGISYEFIKLAGRTDNVVMNILSKPGMWIQRLTTKEPKEEMIQVAIISVEAVLYGKAYVKAVNEAQGLGQSQDHSDSKKSKEKTKKKNKKENKKENKKTNNPENEQSDLHENLPSLENDAVLLMDDNMIQEVSDVVVMQQKEGFVELQEVIDITKDSEINPVIEDTEESSENVNDQNLELVEVTQEQFAVPVEDVKNDNIEMVEVTQEQLENPAEEAKDDSADTVEVTEESVEIPVEESFVSDRNEEQLVEKKATKNTKKNKKR